MSLQTKNKHICKKHVWEEKTIEQNKKELLGLTVEQRLNRIENRIDTEDELSETVFAEYEAFLQEQTADAAYQKCATELLATLYWHRMETYAQKATRFAKDAVRRSPNEKGCQWILQQADGHAAWDWNISNHTHAIEFYRELLKGNPDSGTVCSYLLDNLIADHRTDEAEDVLKRMEKLPDSRPIIYAVYRAHIALARFDEATADAIIENLTAEHGEESACLFEAAQYYAAKCDYESAIAYYERSFEKETRRPRFQDELQGIADIYRIKGEYKKAAETYDRIIALLETEWEMTDEVELQHAKDKKAELLKKA